MGIISSRLELEKDNRILINVLVSIRKIVNDIIIDEPIQPLQDILDIITKVLGDDDGYRNRD